MLWVQDLTGRRSNVRVNTDSSAARGIAMRHGVGKVRHLEVRTLWRQHQMDPRLVQIAKIAGETRRTCSPSISAASPAAVFLNAARTRSTGSHAGRVHGRASFERAREHFS